MATITDTEKATKSPIKDLPAAFMLDMDTYATGGELGFTGMDFYTCGRGGALGDVDADVVSAAFVFFNPALLREQWERGASVMGRHEAAEAFLALGYAWAEANLADGVDYDRLNELLGTVIAGTSPAGVPLFAAWRAMPEPTDAKPLALHRLHVLRELRGGLHGACVVATGLPPALAAQVNDPFMAGIFGWGDAPDDVEQHKPTWEQADAATSAAVAQVFAVLDEDERGELIELSRAARG